jgi:subtilase family serine protease
MRLKTKSLIAKLNSFGIVGLSGLLCGAFALSLTAFSANESVKNQEPVGPSLLRPRDHKRPSGQPTGVANVSGKIVFGRGGFGRFNILTADDIGGQNSITELTNQSEQEPVFSPDGNTILFKSFRDYDSGVFSEGDLYSMNANGYDQARLTANASPKTNYSYSPDSSQIVFIVDGNVWKMNADGSSKTQLADLVDEIIRPAFSPDGAKIIFLYDGTIWRMDADGANQAELSSPGDKDSARYSPDGLRIIFSSAQDVYTMDADGTNETKLIDQDDVNYDLDDPVYSPDGTKILMECRGASGINVCTANADGSGFTPIAGTNVERSNRAWSPDSGSVAFIDRNRSTNKYAVFTSTIAGTPQLVYLEDSSNILQYLAWQSVCSSATPTPTPTPNSIPGLISEWNANDLTADDSTGVNNGQFLDGAALINPGKVGYGFYFAGDGGFIEIPDSDSLDVQTGDYTLSTWFNPIAATEHYVAGKGACGENSSNFYIGVGADYVPFIDISHPYGGSRVSNGGFVLSQSVWHHLLLRKQGTNFKLFVDGVEAVSHDDANAFNTGGQPFTIGKGDACAAPQLTTNGGVDEVRLYGRALSNAEIDDIYHALARPFSKTSSACPPPADPAVLLKVNYPNPVAAGRVASIEVRLRDAAPAGGTVVNLASSDTGIVTVPATVTIPEGYLNFSYDVNTTTGSAFRSADIIATLGPETARVTVSVAPAAPDVAVSNLTAPASVNILENFTANWTVTNHGEAPTVSYRQDTFYISADNLLFNDPNDKIVGRSYDNLGVLAPGASKNMSFNEVNIPSNAIPVDGTYYLFVYIGDAGTVQERNGNFSDNFISIPIQVNRNLPDVVAENIVTPTEIEPNSTFDVSWDVRNQGSRATGSGFSHSAYLSFDGTVGNADDVPITFRTSPALGINESGSYTQQFSVGTLPLRPSSDALIYVKVDTGNQVFEGEPGSIPETNNTTTHAVRFEYRVPDLQVPAVSTPVEVESDTPFDVSWTTKNFGLKTAAAMNERVYFSTDAIVNANDVEIGSFALAQTLTPDQSIDRIQTVSIPTNAITVTGDYYVYVKTDADGAVDEGGYENNNITFHAVRVRRLLRPDLQVTNITAPATALFDQEIQVQWTVTNTGSGPTNVSSWTDNLYLGVNQTLNGANILATSPNASYLNPGESYITSATVRIPRGSEGSFYLIVQTDLSFHGVSEVNEENENNNIATHAITVSVPPEPDLRVSNVQAPLEGFGGQPINLSWTVRNNGDGASPAGTATWNDLIYISRNAVLDGGDRVIGFKPHTGALAVNGSYTVSGFSINLPPDVFGDYYVFVVADGYDQVFEFTNETNNSDYDRLGDGSPMHVLGAPPDLTVLNPITAPASTNAGQQISVSFIVKNQGAFDAAGSWREAVYLSAAPTFDPNNVTFLGNTVHTILAAGQQYQASMDVTIPNCLNGTYYLFTQTDSNENIFEYDPNADAEANNLSQPKAINIASFAPDLRVTQITVPPIVNNGSMPMSWTVKNLGTAATTQTAWTDRVFLYNGDQVINLGFFDHQGALSINGEYTQNQVVQIPLFLEGSFHIVVRTDSGNVVPECAFDENNDDYRIADIQQDLPDLRITGVTSPGTAALGSTFSASWTGGNLGAAMTQTSSWVDTVYLSSDNTFGPGDIPIGSHVNSGLLAANQGYSANTNVTIPNVSPGNYYLFVNADSGDNIAEGVNESNNASNAVSLTLTAPDVDLQVTNLTVNPSLYSGQLADISWTVSNNGVNATVSNSWTDYVVLSRDLVIDPSDRVIEFRQHNGVLNGGASYTETQSILIPGGLTGEYKIFVITDRNNYVVESNDANNTSAPVTVDLQLPPPVELNITHITPPSGITLGESAVFDWTVQNSSANPASGTWQDSVYLSHDATWDSSDILVGQKQHSGSLGSFATYTETLNTVIPPIETGSYYVIVRTDSRNAVRESNESNNVSNSVGQTTVSIATLTLGTPLNTSLVTGQERFYSIFNVPGDETMLVTLTGEAGSSNELYSRYGSMVSRSNYEYQGERQGEPNQENVVGNTTAGTYNTMIRGDYVPGSFAAQLTKADETKAKAESAAQAVILKAELLPFGIRTVSPGEAGNKGYTMVSVQGAKFVNGASVKIVGPGGVEISPENSEFLNSTHVAALFNLNGKTIGNYQIVLTNPNSQTSTWSQNFVIREGGGANTRTEISGSSEVRGNTFIRYTVSVSNDGFNDALKIPIVIILSGGAREYQLSRANYVELDDSDTPASPDSMHFDVDDKRVIALYAPIIRSHERINIGIDVKFTNRGLIEAFALPSIHSPALASQFQSNHLFAASGDDLVTCWANLVFNTALTVLSELLPLKCAKAVASFLAGDLATAVFGGLRTGGYVSWWSLGSLATKALRAATECAKNLAKYFPPAKIVSIIYDVVQTALLLTECLVKTGGWVVASLSVHTNLPNDPNDKAGPLGYGPEKFVPVDSPLPYRINFENKSDATAPAHRIRVVDQLPPTLDPRTARLTEIGFKQYRIVIPPNRSFYQTRMQLGPDLNNLQADISAGLNIATGTITWTLTAIDPATGEEPISPSVGLLPPNNPTNDGQGYVSYTVVPKANQVTRTDLANSATIYFDDNEPIATNTTTNLLDADIPVSQIAAIPPTTTSRAIPLSWSGSDDSNGSGLANYDIFVSENGGEYFRLLSGTTDTRAVFNGKYGRSYRFYSVARDNAGNIESVPATEDASIMILGGAYESDVASRPNGDNDGTVNDQDVAQVRRFAAKLDTDFQYNEFQRADAAPLADGGDGALSVADVMQARRFASGLDPIRESTGPLSAALFTSNGKRGKSASLASREVHPAFVSRTGNKVVIGVVLEAQGDEAGVGFTLNYNTAELANPANVLLGSGTTGGVVTVNTTEAGKVGVIVDKLPGQPVAAGSRQVVTIQFDVLAISTSQTQITFGSDPVADQIVDGTAAALTTSFTNAMVSLNGPTAANGSVSGAITDGTGVPVSGVTITLNGTQSRATITDANGHYGFENVESNGFYTITPARANYTFSPRDRSFSLLGTHSEATFTASTNGDHLNAIDTPEFFVRQHYLDFLGREPDESGFNFWSDQLVGCRGDAGCIERKRVNVSAAYFLSIEFQQTGGLVDSLYRVSYARRPLYAEFMPDTASLAHGVVVGKSGWEQQLAANRRAFVEAWVQRPTFVAAFGNLANDRYVDALIADTGVAFTAGERDALISGLTTGSMTRADVLRSIAENERFVSAKFNETFVMMEYFGYLRRDPDDSGFQFWLTKLNQFNGNFDQAEMVKAFIVSGEYRNRFPR